MARTLLGIAIAEMMHLQKLGELIVLLGGNVDFSCKTCNGRPKLWSPEYLTIPENIDKMLTADIEAEKDAVRQYEMHIKMIDDDCVNAVLRRIILDEEYHIMLLKSLRSGT
jgi:bacterioferritin